jgi:hypothetical protein
MVSKISEGRGGLHSLKTGAGVEASLSVAYIIVKVYTEKYEVQVTVNVTDLKLCIITTGNCVLLIERTVDFIFSRFQDTIHHLP